MLKMSCRYSSILKDLLTDLKATKVLHEEGEGDYQGYLDCDVELADGRVFSYKYYYGSCPGCDCWEADNLSDESIKKIMLAEATFFDTVEQYQKSSLFEIRNGTKSDDR